ncbi:hypothetical protein D3C81_1157480 [compost metagenome]
MYSIQNRMKRLWTVPAMFRADGSAAFEHVNIAPGTSAFVNDDHWAHVSKGNKVIEALLTERSLVVTKGEKQKADIVEAEELQNPASPAAPADLTEGDARVKLESQVELKEVELKDDAPAAGKGRK